MEKMQEIFLHEEWEKQQEQKLKQERLAKQRELALEEKRLHFAGLSWMGLWGWDERGQEFTVLAVGGIKKGNQIWWYPFGISETSKLDKEGIRE
jgi:hypothetical protein